MDFVEQLKTSIDIVDVVGQYVRLKKVGARYTGLCPFHTEKTPSFSVHSVHQFYKCFGCGAGGDLIKFVMEIDGLTFYEALRQLAEKHGIPMPKREYSDPDTKLRAALYRMHEIAEELFRQALASRSGAEARAYLERRGVSAASIEQFRLGYADSSGQAAVRAFEKEGFTGEQLEASGLVLRRQEGGGFFDRFRGRLMFPIHNEGGKTIAFGGRALAGGQEPKYLNSSETAIYRKSYVLYNLHRAREAIRKNGRAVLVEGYMDVIGVSGSGVAEVVASCGTSLVSQQVRALRRHAEWVVVNFDPDPAGMKAAERSIQLLLEEGARVRILELEGGLDPDEYVKDNGADAYREKLDKAPGYFYWLADQTRAKFDMSSMEGRIAGLQFLLPSIQRIPEPLERATIANELAGYLRLDAGPVLDQFRKMAAERRERTLKAPAGPAIPDIERVLLGSLLASEEARAASLPKLKELAAVERFATRRIFQALFSMAESPARFTLADLQARLEENDQELIARLVFADESREDVFGREQALSCLDKLEKQYREARRAELKARIREAERAGMLEEALRYAEELGRLDRA